MAGNLKSDPVKSVLTITVGFLILGVWNEWKWALTIAGIVGVSGILSVYLAKKIEFVWFKIAWILSLIVPNIVLSIVFFFILTPLAFLSRIFGKKDPLMLKNNNSSTFITVDKKFDKQSFVHPW